MGSSGQSFGHALPDQVERISALLNAHIELISDARELYKDRAALEREYAAKLQALAKKAAEKKSKMECSFVVGEDYSKALDPSTLKQSTLNLAYEGIINSMASTAQDHLNVADVITSQIIDVLKLLERKNEDMLKKESLFYDKLLSDRNRVYADRLKSKQKYDDDCAEVEASRQKQGRASDDRHAERVARQAEQQKNDMLNSKNAYLISTAIANKVKDRFFNVDLVDYEDQLQTIQTRLVKKFTNILLHAQALQMSHLDVLKSRLAATEATLNQVSPSRDQDLFVDHNIRSFSAPDDWKFEPCLNFYDTDVMNTDPAPKVFLQNKLRRSRAKLQELGPVIDNKQKEFDQLVKLYTAYDEDRSLGNVDDISDNYLETNHQLVYFKTSECILNTEIETIVGAIGDDVGAQQPHSFKSSSFSIPTTCGYCKTSIWGLSKQGKTCKACNLSVHSKCELKVPADCQRGGGVSRHSSTASRLSTSSNRKSALTPSAMETPTPSSFVKPVPEEEISYPVASVLFDFTATSEFELSVSEGSIVNILEPDDGSGWVKVADGRSDGLVPASYLEHRNEPLDKVLSTNEQDSGQYVRAIYAYKAGGPDELGLKEGDLIELSSGPSGGQHYGEGWWEGINSSGRKGIFPSNYVEMA